MVDIDYFRKRQKLIELRYNPYHDPSNGRFTSGGGGGGGAVLMIPKGHKGVYKGYKKELAKSSMAAGKMAAERIQAMGGTADEWGNYNYAEHGGLKRFSGAGSQTPTATINVQTGNVTSQATNSGNGLTNSGSSATIKSTRDCENHEQLAAYWKNTYGVTIDASVSDLNFKATKRALVGAESVIQEFPDVGNSLETITCRDKGKGVMFCSGRKLYFNPHYFKGENAETQLNATCKAQSSSGWWPANSSIESIGAHETGHAVERMLANSNPTNYSPIMRTLGWDTHTESKAIVSRACKNVKKTAYGKGEKNADLIKSISRYALDGDKVETFAEAFADVFANGANAKPLSTEIVSLAKQRSEEYKGV